MEDSINSIIYFIFDIPDKDRKYPDTMLIEEIPLKLHQKILRELHIVEALIDVLNISQQE